MKNRLLIVTLLSAILLGVLHQIGGHYYLYWDSVSFDTFMHLLGGFTVALIYIWVMYRNRPMESNKKDIYSIFFFVIFVGVAWEVFEAYYDIAAPVGGGYVVDTTRDLVADVLGGAIAIALGVKPLIHKQNGI